MLSQRDYYEYGVIRNLSIVVPVEGSMVDPNAGPIEREEMERAYAIDLECERRRKNDKKKKYDDY